MPTQLQLEGAELEPLLDRVRSELGPGARIVQAEKVRTGGVAGFFARQRFELTVELPDGADEPAQAPDPAVPAPRAASPKPTSLLDLADQVSSDEQAAAVSTESPTFASLLNRLGSAIGGTPTAPAAAAAAPVPGAAPAPAEAPAATFAEVRERTLAQPAVADRRRTPAAAQEGSPAVPQNAAPAAPPVSRSLVESAPVPSQRRSSEPSSAVALRSSAVLDQPTASSPAPGNRLPTWPSSGDAGAGTGASVELARLGLPAHLRPAVGGDGLYPALVDALKQLPKVPRTSNRAGALLAVVGPLPLALEVAREIAQEMGLPVATAVVVATPSRTATGINEKNVVRSTSIATERRALWRRRRNLTIVAVDAPLTSAGAAQGRDFLAALEPTATWGAVEATRKAHDVGTWTRALGGVHALALTGVEETADPAAVLELGIPVGRVGHRPATPAVWASLLTGRLAA